MECDDPGQLDAVIYAHKKRDSRTGCLTKNEIIVDGGASGTVGRLVQVAAYCEKMRFTPDIEYLGKNANHWALLPYHPFKS